MVLASRFRKFCEKKFGNPDIHYSDIFDDDERQLYFDVKNCKIEINGDGEIVEDDDLTFDGMMRILDSLDDGELGGEEADFPLQPEEEKPSILIGSDEKSWDLSGSEGLMPFVRGLPSVPPGVGRKPEHTVLMRELQVADLRWIHSNHQREYAGLGTSGLPKMLSDLCQKEEFDEVLARAIAERGVKGISKVEELGILRAHQYELCILRSDDVHDRQRYLKNRRDEVERCLLSMGRFNSHVRGNEKDWSFAWMAGELADDMEEAATGHRPEKTSQKLVSEVYRQIGGKAIAPASVAKKLRSVREYIYGKPSTKRRKRIIRASLKHQVSTDRAPERPEPLKIQAVGGFQVPLTVCN